MRRTWGYNLKSDILSHDWFCQLSALRQLLLFILCYWARGWEQTRHWWFPGVARRLGGSAWAARWLLRVSPGNCPNVSHQASTLHRARASEADRKQRSSKDAATLYLLVMTWVLSTHWSKCEHVDGHHSRCDPIIWWSLVLYLDILYSIKWKNNHQINR